jgi:hypothetical protein
MKVFRKKSTPTQFDRKAALKFTPLKNIQVSEERLESGEILIRYPITMRPWIASLAKRFGGSPDRIQTKPLQLDTLGTEVWELIDGNRSVGQIIKVFAERHRLQIREAEVAVSQFIRQLGHLGLIGMR